MLTSSIPVAAIVISWFKMSAFRRKEDEVGRQHTRWHWSASPSRCHASMVARPPEFGEQTDEVLEEFGFDANEIAALKTAKIV
jgi:crotonobetainyl-CoA:carnitine CoA-transferase CaiB-like acyl-CoA transferase